MEVSSELNKLEAIQYNIEQALKVVDNCESCREISIIKTKLQESIHWIKDRIESLKNI